MPENSPQSPKPSTHASRREMLQLGNALLVPALAGGSASVASAAGSIKVGPEIYQSIGVEPVINCRGTFTIIGASTELPEVRAAMNAASQHYVQMDELAEAVGHKLAELTGAEWGMVSSGCAAGLKHTTAACVTGGNPEKLLRIPNLQGFDKTEVVAPRSSRNVYDHAVRNIGVRMITVETAEEFANALSSRTAMIYLAAGRATSDGPLSLENIARMAKPLNIPILVDAAAEVLTIPNVHLAKGATVVAYSGGKAICGPQCAGLLLGRKDILQSAWQASSPHHGPGRDNKVGREETVGMVAAVEAWTKRDHQAEWTKWLSYLDVINKRVSSIDGITTKVVEPTALSNRSPSLVISWDPAALHITGEELAETVARTKPRIALGSGGGPRRTDPTADSGKTSIDITAWMMHPGDDKVVADRLFALLSEKRSPKPPVAAPAGNLTGRWDVQVAFFSSQGKHTLILDQQNSQLQGSHEAEFSVRDIYGTINGDQVVLRSVEPMVGDNLQFTFAGTLTGETMAGKVFMGEYLTATFTAARHAYPAATRTFVLPGGPPLAN